MAEKHSIVELVVQQLPVVEELLCPVPVALSFSAGFYSALIGLAVDKYIRNAICHITSARMRILNDRGF